MLLLLLMAGLSPPAAQREFTAWFFSSASPLLTVCSTSAALYTQQAPEVKAVLLQPAPESGGKPTSKASGAC